MKYLIEINKDLIVFKSETIWSFSYVEDITIHSAYMEAWPWKECHQKRMSEISIFSGNLNLIHKCVINGIMPKCKSIQNVKYCLSTFISCT